MLRLIKGIFEENNYQIRLLEPEETIILASDSTIASYYLTIFLDGTEFDKTSVDQFNDYYGIVKGLEEGYEPQMDKNLSMLICVKRTQSGVDTAENKRIFDIEEDPYLFKKYVLTYTDLQLDMALQKTDDRGVMSYLHSLLNDEIAFQEHKQSPNSESEYNLVSKLFIKLPFLDLTKRNREISSLKDTITSSLSPELLQLRNDLFKLNIITVEDAEGDTVHQSADAETLRTRLLEYIGMDVE
ncbi:ABC-three component system middle component 1 [Paenibacillus planticolens]|uniref:Uncharacterized protein n=1 Tax=Paenibacillus planticolens TaxID=2654976 RepID=A0ABX1ZWS1_9BACL|nr:ABC-three component system middle component 1 [Paenibacillus planticolens]NOV04313.1 hypothetical protein [Paenibacillus planticolens]